MHIISTVFLPTTPCPSEVFHVKHFGGAWHRGSAPGANARCAVRGARACGACGRSGGPRARGRRERLARGVRGRGAASGARTFHVKQSACELRRGLRGHSPGAPLRHAAFHVKRPGFPGDGGPRRAERASLRAAPKGRRCAALREEGDGSEPASDPRWNRVGFVSDGCWNRVGFVSDGRRSRVGTMECGRGRLAQLRAGLAW